MPENEMPKVEPSEFAVVALMGRAEYAGKVSTEKKWGTELLRVDVPTVTKGGVERPGFTLFVNTQNSVYSITPCDEETAKAHTWYHTPDAISPWIIKNYLQTALPDAGGSRPTEQIVRCPHCGDPDWALNDDGSRYCTNCGEDYNDDPESDELVPAL